MKTGAGADHPSTSRTPHGTFWRKKLGLWFWGVVVYVFYGDFLMVCSCFMRFLMVLICFKGSLRVFVSFGVWCLSGFVMF